MAKNMKYQYMNYFLSNRQIANKESELDLNLWKLK